MGVFFIQGDIFWPHKCSYNFPLMFSPRSLVSPLVFFDDFYIYNYYTLHLVKLEEGFERIHSLGGQLNVDNYHITKRKVTLLGHVVVAKRGIKDNP